MEQRHREITRRPLSVLVASTMSMGSRQEFDAHHFAFDSSTHAISMDPGFLPVVTTWPESAPNFWSHYVERARSAGRQLIDAVRSSRTLVEPPAGEQHLLEGFLGITAAMQEVVPFVLATPAVLDVFTSLLTDGVTAVTPEAASELLPRLLTRWAEPDAAGDIRNGYRIALEIVSDEAAAELFRTTAPKIALRRVGEEFPNLDQMIRQHVDQYGWLRTQGYLCLPMSPEDLVYRIQLVVLRWSSDAIAEAAQAKPIPTAAQVLGFLPSEVLAGQIAAFQAMVSERPFGVDALLQAECVARPFLTRIADALGCTGEQILFASADEIVAGLSKQAELPIAAIDSRMRHGFTLQRDHDTMVVEAAPEGASATGGTGVLTGMTACRGTAVGRVRIILDQAELLHLEMGDVLVTAASTIDPTDPTGGTVFPTRNGGPYARALDRLAAVVADEGGLLSHGAIVCRERGLPCVLDAETATTALADGQIVEVDATKPVGVVIPLDRTL